MKRLAVAITISSLVLAPGACSGDSNVPQAEGGADAAALFNRAVHNTAGFQGPFRAHLRSQRGDAALTLRSHYNQAKHVGTFSLSAADHGARVIVQHDQFWARLDSTALQSHLRGDARWITGSFKELQKLGTRLELDDNAAQLYLLLAANGIQTTGTASVKDHPVRTYTFHTSKRHALEVIVAAGHKAVSQVLLVGGPENKITGQVAIDGDERVRRFRFATTVDPPQSENQLDIRIRGTYTGFGEPVKVNPPPASKVAELSEIRSPRGMPPARDGS